MERIIESIVSMFINNFRTQTKIEDLGDRIRIKTQLLTSKDEVHIYLTKDSVRSLKELINSLPDK